LENFIWPEGFNKLTLKKETFEKYSVLSKVKEGENIALTLHLVQPQEYIEYFAD
jgi:hypothetical protein